MRTSGQALQPFRPGAVHHHGDVDEVGQVRPSGVDPVENDQFGRSDGHRIGPESGAGRPVVRPIRGDPSLSKWDQGFVAQSPPVEHRLGGGLERQGSTIIVGEVGVEVVPGDNSGVKGVSQG